MHYWPSLPQLVGRHVNIITSIISHICLHHPVHGSIFSWSLSLCFFFSQLISSSLMHFLWIKDSFSSRHLLFSIFLSLSIPSFIPQHKWCTLSPALLSLLSLSRCHYKRWTPIELTNPECTLFTHWLMSLRGLWEGGMRVAKLTASSGPKHIKGSASN